MVTLLYRMFPWGNTFKVKGKHQCNTWQGEFPINDNPEDGHAGPAPVWKFKQNNFDLYNMVGNVWEWTADWWSIRHSQDFQENPVRKNICNHILCVNSFQIDREIGLYDQIFSSSQRFYFKIPEK